MPHGLRVAPKGINSPVLLFFFNFLKLIYNIVLISAVQQSDSVIHIHTFKLSLTSPPCLCVGDRYC